VDCLDTLGTLLAGAALLGFALASLFGFGSKIGVWFSSVGTENRKLYGAAIGLVCWTVAVAAVAWCVSFLVYVVYIGEQPDTPTGWTGAASIALLLASPVVAMLAGIPWLVLVGALRVLRWRAGTFEGREHSE